MNLVIPLLFLASIAMAQSPGTFTATGDMTRPRKFHTATLLPNGKVLIAGGSGLGFPTWASAELYDPSTGSFTATGDMTMPRSQHTATLLPGGAVLIAGGSNSDAPLASAELYNPATGAFHATDGMISPRRFHTATLLNNGKVLIAGGNSGAGAELYDPSTGSFTATGSLTEPGADTATLLPNGKVLITLTRSVRFFEEGHADLYDPAAGTFTRTGDLIDPKPGQQPTSILLLNGKVLVAGGSLVDFGSANAKIYDAFTGAFTNTGQMTAGLDLYAAATILPEGKVFIAGRYNGGEYCALNHIENTCPGVAEVYDPVRGTFSPPAVSQSMEGHAATLLPDGTVLLSGGWRCCGLTIATAEIYQPAVLLASPVLFSLSGDARGQGAILHGGTARVVSSDDPASAGEALEIYGTGLIEESVIPPQVAIGGILAEVLYFGKVPGLADVNQVNVLVPSGVAAGPTVPVRLTYLGRPSNEVTIGLQ